MDSLLMVSIWSVIYTIGVAGNLFVIFSILYLQKVTKISHWYVLQLAIADILFLQSVPLKITEMLQQDWILGIYPCKVFETLKYINYYASILFITAMAIDRYLAVCRSLWSATNSLRSIKSGCIGAAIIWVLSVSMSLPVSYYSDSVEHASRCHCVILFTANDATKQCRLCHPACDYECGSLPWEHDNETFTYYDINREYENSSGDGSLDYYGEVDIIGETYASCYASGADDPGMTKFILFNFIAMFLFPLLVITISYGCIVLRLRKTRLRSRRSFETKEKLTSGIGSTGKSSLRNTGDRKCSSDSHKRVTALCVSLLALLVICWLPFHVVQVARISGISGSETFCENLQMCLRFLIYLNSALNPFLYNFLGTFKQRIREFRKHRRTKRIMSGLGCRKIVAHSTTNVSDVYKTRRSYLSSGSDTNSRKEDIPLKDLTLSDPSSLRPY